MIGPTLLEKLKFSSSTCPLWSKMTILSKILDRPQLLEKLKFFILDMSAVVKKDNFEQILVSNIGKIEILILDMSAVHGQK